jgi:dihydrofolate reductase
VHEAGVLHHHDPPTWKNTRHLKGGLEDEIRRLKQEPGKDINIQGSASIVQALERADLVDAYRLYVHPVLLGGGTPLFASKGARQDFERTALKPYASGVIGVTYRRRR